MTLLEEGDEDAGDDADAKNKAAPDIEMRMIELEAHMARIQEERGREVERQARLSTATAAATNKPQRARQVLNLQRLAGIDMRLLTMEGRRFSPSPVPSPSLP